MRKPVQDGFQSLIGTETEVVSRLASDGSIKYLVRSQGELWSAYSTDVLETGELVNIVALKGIGVVVKRVEKSSRPGEIDSAKTELVGGKSDKRHCY
ncbi:NfeD family protein [Chloroflexota bacterium]